MLIETMAYKRGIKNIFDDFCVSKYDSRDDQIPKIRNVTCLKVGTGIPW